MTDTPIIISGCSASGKTTIANQLKHFGFNPAIGSTTRKPRAGEIDGVDYDFVDASAWNPDSYIETNFYDGNNYGYSTNNLRLTRPIFIVNVDALLSYPLHNAFRVVIDVDLRVALKRRPQRRQQIVSEFKFVRNNLILDPELLFVQNNNNENPKKIASQIAQAYFKKYGK